MSRKFKNHTNDKYCGVCDLNQQAIRCQLVEYNEKNLSTTTSHLNLFIFVVGAAAAASFGVDDIRLVLLLTLQNTYIIIAAYLWFFYTPIRERERELRVSSVLHMYAPDHDDIADRSAKKS